MTNAFHMSFGDMTITLDDVIYLIGRSVTRLHVLLTGHGEEIAHELVVQAFELSETVAKLSLAKSNGITWLCSSFSDLLDVANDRSLRAALGLTFCSCSMYYLLRQVGYDSSYSLFVSPRGSGLD